MSIDRRRVTALATAAVSGIAAVFVLGAAPAAQASNHAGRGVVYGSADDFCAGTTPAEHTAPSNQPPVPLNDSARVVAGSYVEIDVLANDTDPDGDALSVTNVGSPRFGAACVQSDNTVLYMPDAATRSRTDVFTYGVTDGDYYRTASVTVSVQGLVRIKPKLIRKIVFNGHGNAKHAARYQVTNGNTRSVEFLAGNINRDRPEVDAMVKAGRTRTFSSRTGHMLFYAVMETADDELIVSAGFLNTTTGSISWINPNNFRAARGRPLPWGH